MKIQSEQILEFITILCRIIPILTFLPGMSYVPHKIKITSSVLISTIVYSIVEVSSNANYIALLVQEMFIGLFIGTTVYTIFSATQIASSLISMQSGISAAALGDNGSENGGSNVSKFIILVSIALFFSTDAVLIILQGIVNSYYKTDAYKEILNVEYLIISISESFDTGIRIAAPIICISLILYIATGITNKLIPNIQVFLIAAPGHILICLSMFTASISGAMLWYLQEVEDKLIRLFALIY